MKRIGKANDGGYVICELPGYYDGFISGGVANDVSFEEEFCSLYSINCTAYDGTVSSLPSSNPAINFVKKNMGAFNTASMTNCISEVKTCSNLFLKMDIEGHEFRILPSLLPYFDRIKQMVIEFHTPADMNCYPDHFSGFNDIRDNPETLESLIGIISATHTLVHFHANNGCATHVYKGSQMPNVFECTFVRNDFVTEHLPHPGPLPGPHDMPNITYKPDYTCVINNSFITIS
jgi:hypothetical protein